MSDQESDTESDTMKGHAKEVLERYYSEELERAEAYQDTSIEIEYSDIVAYNPDLADDLDIHPSRVLKGFRRAASELRDLDEGVEIRISPQSSKREIRNIRTEDMGKLVTIDGVISQASEVKAQVDIGAFECEGNCASKIVTVEQNSEELTAPTKCKACDRKMPFRFLPDQSEWSDVQHIRVQESPEELRAGETPEYIDTELYGDLCHRVAPGDRVTLVGIVSEEKYPNNRQMSLCLETNNVVSRETDMDSVELSDEDRERIHEAAERDDIEDALVDSFAPSIHGYETEKRAMLYQLFGSPIKELADDTEKRGDVHVLLIGDPGTGKSQLIEYAHEVAPRSVHTSAKNATGVGLTATAEQDDFGESTEWTIKPGALPMADKGLIAVDELDKTDKESRGALHEALEQQQVSYSKAGKTGQFRARCSLLAAANPSEGRFDEYDSIVSQVDLEPPLVSRFDLIFTVTDQPEEDSDRELAEHILDSIQEAQSGEYDVTEPEYETEFLRKYISYARRKIEPKLTDGAYEELAEWYVDFRGTDDDTDTVPATARQLEAAERLAEASARTRLSDEVTREDVENAIGLLMSSLLRVGRDPETGNFDADIIETGTSKSQRDRIKALKDIIDDETEEGSARIEDVVARAENADLMPESDVREQIKDWYDRGEIYKPSRGEVRLT